MKRSSKRYKGQHTERCHSASIIKSLWMLQKYKGKGSQVVARSTRFILNFLFIINFFSYVMYCFSFPSPPCPILVSNIDTKEKWTHVSRARSWTWVRATLEVWLQNEAKKKYCNMGRVQMWIIPLHSCLQNRNEN